MPSVLDCASGTVNGNTAMGTANINNYACRSYSYPNNEQVHGFRAATDSLVRVVATRGSGSSRDYDLYVLNAGDGTAPCGSTLTCAGASTGTTATETVTFAATAGQLYYVAYDLFGTTAETIDYTLEVSCSPLPTNTTCAGAMPITATTALTGELIDIGGARPTGTGCGTTAGNNARYYSVTVPANGFVDVRTSSSTGLDRVLLVQDACGDTCTFQTNTSPESTVLTNTTASDVTRIVVIANSSATGTGTFDITFTYGTLPTNTSCATATPVTTTPASFTGQLIDLGGPRPTGTNCGTSSGNNALYYLVTVPAGGAVGVSTAGAFDRVLLVQNACSDTDCAVRTDTAPESTILTNPSSADVTRVVVVYNYSSSGRGAFDISFALVAFETETEPNEDGTPSTGSDAIAGNDLDATAITNADANGAITTTTIVTAALTPAGDEDVFAITNTGTTPRSVTISTGAPTYDVCPSGDTGLRIVRSDLSVVTTSDDEGAGACSLATVTIPAGATYYAQVVEYDDDEALDPYQLFVLFN
ncbi:MAG: hypothetical protein K8H88_22660 [Sandaracinaceae bacterium]|nr:hypothetical protein [Sandaracinaceae bacterium]